MYTLSLLITFPSRCTLRVTLCLFSALSCRVGALQRSIIIIIAHFISNWEQEHCKLWPRSPCPLREISRSRSRTSPASVCMWSSPSVFLHKAQLCFTRRHKLTSLLHHCNNPTFYSRSAKTNTNNSEIISRPFPLTLLTSVDSLSRDKSNSALSCRLFTVKQAPGSQMMMYCHLTAWASQHLLQQLAQVCIGRVDEVDIHEVQHIGGQGDELKTIQKSNSENHLSIKQWKPSTHQTVKTIYPSNSENHPHIKQWKTFTHQTVKTIHTSNNENHLSIKQWTPSTHQTVKTIHTSNNENHSAIK